jgi:spermidine synthase
MTRISREYFHLPDSPQLTIIEEDGRTFLNTNAKKYDVIIMDVFHDYFVPFSLTTKQAVEAMRRSLTKEGVIVVNISSAISGPNNMFFASVYKTYSSLFQSIRTYKVYPAPTDAIQTIIIVASNTPLSSNTKSLNPAVNSLLSSEIPRPINANAYILTDSYAPVETMLVP